MSPETAQPHIGVYMIVRDAADTIDALLSSILSSGEAPPFDEYVFVDTGSVDDTRERIAKWIGISPEGWATSVSVTWGGWPIRVVLANFDWVDDFSAARNYAFGLGMAKWRGYFDADDTCPGASRFRSTLTRIERRPETNCIMMKYQYAEDALVQDVVRFVRWADGWKWVQPIHEHLVRTSGSKFIAEIDDLPVIHNRTDERSHKSLERNLRICQAAYGGAKLADDERQMGIMAHYLGIYANALNRLQEAAGYLDESGHLLPHTNIGCYSLCELTRLELLRGNTTAAAEAAGRAIAAAPELPDGWAALAVVAQTLGHTPRAVQLFEHIRTMPKPTFQATRDVVWLDGVVPTYEAEAWLDHGDLVRASHTLASISTSLRTNDRVRGRFSEVWRRIMKAEGVRRVCDLADFYIWSCEPVKARRLLANAPTVIADSPALRERCRALDAKLTHLNSWEEYKAAYAAIPEDTYHTDETKAEFVRELGRAKHLLAWAQALPKEGEPIELLAVGVQDGLIEADAMAANDRIVITCVDVAPQAAKGIAALRARFGEHRVKTHAIVAGPCDWIPMDARFDAIVLFEVLEHVPDATDALDVLGDALKPDGILFLSTPHSQFWIEPYLTQPGRMPPFYGHVRAFNARSLWKDITFSGLTGQLLSTDNNAIFLAKLRRRGKARKQRQRLAIYVHPQMACFDPQSLVEGHLGGSEEAVVHLAHAMYARGHEVTVYAKQPERSESIHVSNGVLWQPPEAFDPHRPAEDVVLVWRAPHLAAEFGKVVPKYVQVFNWLHDTHYDAAPDVYEHVEGTIVLSKAHQVVLKEMEGVHTRRIAANGIVPEEFPMWRDGERNPRGVIYASSPDRGLINLLRMWPDVRAEVPDAKLDIFYSWDGLRNRIKRMPPSGLRDDLHRLLIELETKLATLRDHGVTYHGGVNHNELHAAYRRASIWAYPTDFYEISCISAMKALASGCWPLVTDVGALPETLEGHGTILSVHPLEAFCEKLINLLKSPPSEGQRLVGREFALTRRTWERAAQKFAEAMGWL